LRQFNFNRRPIQRRQQRVRERQELILFAKQVPALLHDEILRRGDDSVPCNVFADEKQSHRLAEGVHKFMQFLMVGEQIAYSGGLNRVQIAQPRQDGVLFRVMAAVGKIEEVFGRAQNDVVVWLTPAGEDGDLVLDRLQQAHERSMLFEQDVDNSGQY
jgi:hypothetical protein